MWYFFLWIWLFSKCNPAIFVTLHWKHCFHLCMDDVYFLFRFTRPKNTDQTNYYLFNQPTNQPTYRPPPAQLTTRIGPELLLNKKWHSGFEPMCHNIHSDWTHTDFRYFVYSLLIFLWPVLLIFFINDYIWAAKFPSN